VQYIYIFVIFKNHNYNFVIFKDPPEILLTHWFYVVNIVFSIMAHGLHLYLKKTIEEKKP